MPPHHVTGNPGAAANVRALRRLALRYPGVFQQLVNEERAKVGLPPRNERLGRPRGSFSR